MAQKKQYVDLNLNGQQLLNSQLSRAGIQTVADATELGTLTTTLQKLSESKRVFVFQIDNRTMHIWDGDGPSGAFEPLAVEGTREQ